MALPSAHQGFGHRLDVFRLAAHLHGLLSRFQTLGISIAEMRQLPD